MSNSTPFWSRSRICKFCPLIGVPAESMSCPRIEPGSSLSSILAVDVKLLVTNAPTVFVPNPGGEAVTV
ncbi:hypothetical protein ABEW81_26805 [Priestia megaterium]